MGQLCGVEKSLEENTTSCTTDRKKGEENTPGSSTDEAQDSPAVCSDVAENPSEEEENSKLSLISWNVDGLDGEEQPERMRSLCSYLISHSPDVVFLQELIPSYSRFMKKQLAAKYNFIEGGTINYFTGILLKKSRITLLDSEIVAYPTTQMQRNLLVAQVLFKGQKLCLMTSHLESCEPNAAERMRQLRLVMKRMTEAPGDVTVLFGGDTNLTDDEVTEVGLPGCVCDVWEQLGEAEHCRYTWDPQVNTNKNIQFKRQFRFDRLYQRPAAQDGVPQLEPDSMALIGLEKLECGRFTSDHWGILCTFSAE
ncbi:tyrosyl-DNA phosphodiesterase 2-like [Micropterus dolomieu]|uniref:tyrosyl-DNA phosphodiesterase 2-like n=1 Tax=Micropterus dolomieu TaxID=147949 RepID=UPI001E8E2848|nr:tyrosyl-DNA phosphodiesterase 2-like [Micropterus dolomieu]XP_045908086.1 tyrosyl-DNA phosphodiesterase 2-like [Micropterus dolomieu]